MIRILALILLLVFSPAPLWAGVPGTSGATFLKLGAGPRANGMGEAGTAVADDAYATYWNPGGLVQLRHRELAFMYNQGFEGVNQQFVTYAHPLVGGTVLGGSLTRLSVSAFDGFDNNGNRTGSVSSDDLAVGLSAAHAFSFSGSHSPVFGVGATIKNIRERLHDARASAFALDIGILARGLDRMFGDGAKGLRLGLAVRNMGPSMTFVSEETPLPTTWAVAASLERKLWGDPLLFTTELSQANDNSSVFSFGGEYWLHRIVALRLGARTNVDEGSGVRLGLGLKLKLVQMDYSLAMHGELGSTHRVGMSMRFGAPPESARKNTKDFLKTAKEYMRQNRHYEAILEMNEALDEDPGNEEVLELLREAKSALNKESRDGR